VKAFPRHRTVVLPLAGAHVLVLLRPTQRAAAASRTPSATANRSR
jgi:hypothetical protein